MNRFIWLKIYIVIVLLISLSFLSYNLLAQVETEDELKGYIRDCSVYDQEDTCLGFPNCNWASGQCVRKCPDFTDMNALTMKDSCSGLVWARAELPIYHGEIYSGTSTDLGYTWQEAIDACQDYMGGGLFRLPTVEEMLTLVRYSCEAGVCQASLADEIYENPPYFGGGVYWTSSDFNEPNSWTNPAAVPTPGNVDRDYKRSVNLNTGEVDTPVYNKEFRLGAWCIMNRTPEIIERKFISATTSTVGAAKQVIGGDLKTVYNRKCENSNDCSTIGATTCEVGEDNPYEGFCSKTENISLPSAIVVSCQPHEEPNSPTDPNSYHIENNSCEPDKTGTACGQGDLGTTIWLGNDYNGYNACYINNCDSGQHPDPETFLCVDNLQECSLLGGACDDTNALCSTNLDCATGECVNWHIESFREWNGVDSWGPCYATDCLYDAVPVDPQDDEPGDEPDDILNYNAVCSCDAAFDVELGLCTACSQTEHYDPNLGSCVSDCLGGSYSGDLCTSVAGANSVSYCKDNDSGIVLDIACTDDGDCTNTCDNGVCTVTGQACDGDNPCSNIICSDGDCSKKYCQNDQTGQLTSINCLDDSSCINNCDSGVCSVTNDVCDVDNPCPIASCATIDNRREIWQGDLLTGDFQCIFQGCAVDFHQAGTETCQPNTLSCFPAYNPFDWTLAAQTIWDSVESIWGTCNALSCVDDSFLVDPDSGCAGLAEADCQSADTCEWYDDVSNSECRSPELCMCVSDGVGCSAITDETACLSDADKLNCDWDAGACVSVHPADPVIRSGDCSYCGNNVVDPGEECDTGLGKVVPIYERKADVVFIFDTSGSMADEQANVCSEYNALVTDLLNDQYFSEINVNMFALPNLSCVNNAVYPSCETGRLGTVNDPGFEYYTSATNTDCTVDNVDTACSAYSNAICVSGKCQIRDINPAYYPDSDTGTDCNNNSDCTDYENAYCDTAANPKVCKIIPRTVAHDYFGGCGDSEDWGPGIIDIINNHEWLSGFAKVIIPVSDEGPEDGNNWLAEDYIILQEVIDLAQANDITIAPIYTEGIGNTDCSGWSWPSDSYTDSTNIYCAINKLANDTNGKALFSLSNANQELSESIISSGSICDDVTGDDIMDCVFTPICTAYGDEACNADQLQGYCVWDDVEGCTRNND